MTESQKVILEQKAMLVQSDFEDTIYAVDRKGRGMYVIVGDKYIPILAENIQAFALELMDVWETMKPRTVGRC